MRSRHDVCGGKGRCSSTPESEVYLEEIYGVVFFPDIQSTVFEDVEPGYNKLLILRVRDLGHEDKAGVKGGNDRDEDDQVAVRCFPERKTAQNRTVKKNYGFLISGLSLQVRYRQPATIIA